MLVVGFLYVFTDFCAASQVFLLPSGVWNSNMLFYSSLDLHNLKPKVRLHLPVSLYNHCVALGIARRPRYIHRGSRRNQCINNASTTSSDGCTIPVVWSSSRRLRTNNTRHEDRNAHVVNLRHPKYVSPGVTPGITSSSTTVKMTLVNARSLSNKSFILNDFFTSHSLDFLFVTETWLKNGELSALGELSPSDCSFYSTPRPSGHGGGLATIFRNSFKCRLLPVDAFSSFEAQLLKIDLNGPILCVLVYRPPKVNSTFIHEFSEFLSNQVSRYDRLMVLGDFNIHVCCPSKPLVKNFMSLMDSLSFIQSVSSPTHSLGHTLDLVLTRGFSVHICEVADAGISDHFPVVFEPVISIVKPSNSLPVHYSRAFHSTTAFEFSESYSKLISNSTVNSLSVCMDTEQLVEIFNSACCTALNTVAPLKRKNRKAITSPQPWLNAATRTLRQECRRAERRWKKDGLQVSYQILKDRLVAYQKSVHEAKSNYFSHIIAKNANRPKVLFKTINSVLNPVAFSVPVVNPETCTQFSEFFIQKIQDIRSHLPSPDIDKDNFQLVLPSSSFTTFEPVSLAELRKIISQMKLTFCQSDVLPARLFREVLDTISPTLLTIINSSLINAVFPESFKHAIVQPLLKGSHLDPTVHNNYRPISKLCFISKVLEKVALLQFGSYLDTFNILDPFQSGFRALHSTESALLKVSNDILLSIDSGSSAILILLDLSAAFDTIDHDILLNRLQCVVGVQGQALQWFTSYLKGRTFSVNIGSFTSPTMPIQCGVPQGSILGPLLFSLYMLPLGSIFRKYNINYHCYADDLQLYLPIKYANDLSLDRLFSCLNEVKSWMSNNSLQLNENKTEVLLLGPAATNNSVKTQLGFLSNNLHNHAKNLGVYFDPLFQFDKHINAVVKSSFFQLRSVAKVKHFLSRKDLEVVIHALISSRLDYCNSLYIGLPQSTLSRLQMVQNSAARLLTGTRKRDHISPVLASLHWLPIKFRIDFKILLFAYKALHNSAPDYISDLVKPYTAVRQLRSGDQLLLSVPRSRCKSKGDRAFSVAAPKLWNGLPLSIRASPSLDVFKTSLKTYFYTLAFE